MKLAELYKHKIASLAEAEGAFESLAGSVHLPIGFTTGANYVLNNITPQVAIAFGDWLRGLRPDVYHGSPTTEVLFNQFLAQYNPSV